MRTRMLLVALVLVAATIALTMGGLRGMSDGGLRMSAGTSTVSPLGMSDGGLGMSDGGLGMSDGGL